MTIRTGLCAVLALLLDASPVSAAAPTIDATALMDWAETAFPEFFPSRESNRLADPYVYRYYASTGNYLGVSGQHVAVLGPISGGQVLNVGTLAQFRCRVLARACIEANGSRVVRGASFDSAITQDGRVLIWDRFGSNSRLPEGSAPIVGTSAVQLAQTAQQLAISDRDVVLLGLDGTLKGWGEPRGWTGVPLGPGGWTSRVLDMPWPGPVRQMSLGWSYPSALLDDGTVWNLTFPSNVARPTRVDGLSDIVSLSDGGGHMRAVRSDGMVMEMRVDLTSPSPSQYRPVPDATSVQRVSCGPHHCLALRTDRTVVAWGLGPLGDGTTGFSNSAITVTGLSDIVRISAGGAVAGGSMSAAVSNNGQVWVWGRRSSGTGGLLRPAAVPGLSDVTDVSCTQNCLFRRSDGSLWTWDIGPDPTRLSQAERIPGITVP